MSDFLNDVVEGLSSVPRSLPCKYLYDARGSDLFEAICQSDDYYVTRADITLHENHLVEIAKLIGTEAHVIEFGSGAGIKTELLLKALDHPRAYTPIEISPAALESSVAELTLRFPDLDIVPLEADYTQDINPDDLLLNPAASRRLVYFPGSTIGNFARSDAHLFLKRMGKIAQSNGLILIGVDLVKSPETLIRAYDDSQGITAQFNKNILLRMQTELGAELDLAAFEHEARWNDALKRIEMHLVASHATTLSIDEHHFELMAGESIHTENSHKYSIDGFQALTREAGLEPKCYWLDPEGQFSMHLLAPAT